MIDKGLLSLIGEHKKYMLPTVLLMIVGLLANIIVTACICLSIYS